MAQAKKYFKTRAGAKAELAKRNNPALGVFKMSKGTRKAGWYAVCSEMEWLNTY